MQCTETNKVSLIFIPTFFESRRMIAIYIAHCLFSILREVIILFLHQRKLSMLWTSLMV